MPKYARNTTDFSLTVTDMGTGQCRITIPKMMMDRLSSAKGIMGSFYLTKDTILLKEEKQVLTVEQLLSKWWALPDVENIEETHDMSLDDLLGIIGIDLDIPEGFDKNIIISDWDSTTHDQFHVSFNVE